MITKNKTAHAKSIAQAVGLCRDFPIRYAPNRVVRFEALLGFLVKYTRGHVSQFSSYLTLRVK